jgi:putative radical SAM enzyme (TIGR03279 family)
MKEHLHVIASVEPGSIAEELELEAGDILLEINGNKIEDVFDYHYLMNEEYVEILVRKANGEEWELEIEKEFEEDLGVSFENGMMDDYRHCTNKCIFCFIDQMPPGMRETLYFKDDDTRLSFLQGNYVTLTNLKENDVEKIMKYKLSPINISFQTTNPELRCKMLHNRFAGESLKIVDRLVEAGITINGQIVLCKNWNDGEELERSMKDLYRYLPNLQSVSVVPVGLSKYREGLEPLEPFTKEDAKKVIAQIEKWQKKAVEEFGLHFIHASDEWYLLAEEELPKEESYDGYLQLENGVGMLRLLETEFKDALEEKSGDSVKRKVSIATGKLAAPFISKLMEDLKKKYTETEVMVYDITNEFFGERITVAGLITGQDLKKQLKNKDLGEKLLLPCHMLRSGEEVFLDDVTVSELSEYLQIPIEIVDSDGAILLNHVTI